MAPKLEEYLTSPNRTWEDAAGRHSTAARLLEMQGEKAILEKNSGKIIAISKKTLSQADRLFLDSNPFDTALGSSKSSVHSGKVLEVIDGDTIVVSINEHRLRIRLKGVDSPEMKQPNGRPAKLCLESLCLNRSVKIRIKGRDKHDILVATLMIDAIDISLRMLSSGYAWHYSEYNRDKKYAIAEDYARRSKKGIWSDDSPEAPWAWRKNASEVIEQ